jgi:hypothetical protein
MVNTSYSASLVSSLLSTPTKTIRTARDLIESSLQFAAENISYSVGLFAVSNYLFLLNYLKERRRVMFQLCIKICISALASPQNFLLPLPFQKVSPLFLLGFVLSRKYFQKFRTLKLEKAQTFFSCFFLIASLSELQFRRYASCFDIEAVW